jgi:hypothetical protein
MGMGMERASLGDRWALGRPHQPSVTPRKRTSTALVALTAFFTLAMATVSFALDTVDDTVETGSASVSLGAVDADSTHTRSVTLILRYGSGQHADPGQVVKVHTSSASQGAGISDATWTFTVPTSGWGTTVTQLSDTQSIDITVGSADGSVTLKVDCKVDVGASCDDVNTSVATVNFSYTINASPPADITAPVVTISSVTGTGTGSPDTTDPFSVFTKNGVSIDWSADEAGTYAVKLGSCATGTAVAASNGTNVSGTYDPTSGSVTSSVTNAGLGVDGPKTVSVCVTDAATNTGGASASVFKDTVAPSPVVNGVTDVTLGQSLPTVTCGTATDLAPGSGIASQDASPSSSSNLNVNGVGYIDFTCTATDNAGNVGSTTGRVNINYALDGLGIRQPINKDNTSLFKRGQVVPVKFGLPGDEPLGLNTSGWSVKRRTSDCNAFDADDAVTETVPSATASTLIRYDSAADQYIYNADFRSAALNSCWQIGVVLDDPAQTTIYSAIFKIVK